MTKMTKKTFKMEKEISAWKLKYEKANAMLLDLISEKQVRDEHITKTAKQLFHLQKLCRTLSAEKKAYYNKLVECNIEIPEVKDIPKEEIPQELPQDNATAVAANDANKVDKLDEMIKNRDELKKNLVQLQGQLSNLTTSESAAANSASTKKTKSKKSKKNAKNVISNDNPVNEKEATAVAIENPTIEQEAVVVENPSTNGTSSSSEEIAAVE
jgi:hypothetical protein